MTVFFGALDKFPFIIIKFFIFFMVNVRNTIEGIFMEAGVELSSEVKNDVLILRVGGRLDAISSPQLEKQVMESINGGNHTNVLMNFEQVDYLSSAGMRLLLSTTKKMKSKEGKFVISCMTDSVMEVIKMAGFDHILRIKGTEEEGMGEFK
jgi:anti-anti-sigma factor